MSEEKLVLMKLVEVGKSRDSVGAYVMVLQEVAGTRMLPIVIGISEAQSLTVILRHIEPPRPLTHDFAYSALSMFQIDMPYMQIYKEVDGVFFAKICLKNDSKTIFLDVRPSDAVALALRYDAPIFIQEDVLERSYVRFDDEVKQDSYKKEKIVAEMSKAVVEEALKKAIKDENYELAAVLRDELKKKSEQ